MNSLFVHNNMKPKKAISQIVFILISATLIIVAGYVWLVFFGKSSGLGFTNIREKIVYAGDCDDDTVPNGLDKCPCDKSELGSQQNNGCPEGYRIIGNEKGREDRSCLKDTSCSSKIT